MRKCPATGNKTAAWREGSPRPSGSLSLRVLGFGSLLAGRNSGPDSGVCAPALIWPARGSGQGRQRDSGLGRERNRGPDDGGCHFRVKFVRGLGSEWQPSRHLTYRSQWQISLGFEGPLEAITQRASLPVCRLDADGRWRTINAVCTSLLLTASRQARGTYSEQLRPELLP
jgi:hypothetical protein